MQSPDEAWKAWGAQDPYYAVLSEKRFRKEHLPQSRAEFFESGRAYVESLLSTVERLFDCRPASASAIDFGCGVGRLVIPFANAFSQVYGVDISPSMLREASQNAAEFRNISFYSDLGRVPSQVFFVHSFLVFQHIPVKKGLGLMEELFNKLFPGGLAAIHFTIEHRRPPLKSIVYFLKHSVPGVQLLANLLQRKRISEPLMEINAYRVEEVYELACSSGMGDIWFLPSDRAPFSLTLFARKR